MKQPLGRIPTLSAFCRYGRQHSGENGWHPNRRRLVMKELAIQDRAIDRFILDFIDSVPHLEALLLLWRSRPKAWTDEQIGKRLYLDGQAASELMEGLVRRGLIAEVPGRSRHYRYEAGERDKAAGGRGHGPSQRFDSHFHHDS